MDLHHLPRFLIPSGHVIEVPDVFPLTTKDGHQVIALFGAFESCSHKRRVAHNIIQLSSRDHLIPIHPQGVSFMDIRIGFERQRVEGEADNLVSLLHHLRLSDPEGGLSHGAGEVVDLNAVELVDGNLDRVC